MPSNEYFDRKRKYIQKYNRSHYVNMTFAFRKNDQDDMKIYDYLRSQQSTNAYIKNLVKNDLEQKEDHQAKNQVIHDGSVCHQDVDLSEEEKIAKAEEWFYNNFHSWDSDDNGIVITVDDAPDYVYEYAKKLNDELKKHEKISVISNKGNNIAFYRVKHGLTQKEFATLVGMHTHAVGYAENHHCSAKLARDAAMVLGENVFDVLGSDVLKILPNTEEDKQIIINMIMSL